MKKVYEILNPEIISCYKCKIKVNIQTGYVSSDEELPLMNDDNLGKWIIENNYALFINLLCPLCGFWNIFEKNLENSILPSNKYDKEINNLDGTIKKIYSEIQDMANQSRWRIVILLSRILIMHLAIENGAKENLSFKLYVEKNNLVNKKLSKLVSRIRESGNNLNHKVKAYDDQKDDEIRKTGEIYVNVVQGVLDHIYKYAHLESENQT